MKILNECELETFQDQSKNIYKRTHFTGEVLNEVLLRATINNDVVYNIPISTNEKFTTEVVNIPNTIPINIVLDENSINTENEINFIVFESLK